MDAVEQVAMQAEVIRQVEGRLATARALLTIRVRNASDHGATVQAIAEAAGLSETDTARLIEEPE
jgi:hypothetical protein